MRGICHAARQLKVELKGDALRQAANVQKLETLSEYALIVDAIGGRIAGGQKWALSKAIIRQLSKESLLDQPSIGTVQSY